MNLLIIENDLYLAQKIASRLLDDGHSCIIVETSNAIPDNANDFDIVLISSSMHGVNCADVIKKFKNSICIILASYISDETVTNPIKCGAKEYLIKPFIMDELLRKIYHHKEYNKLTRELTTMKNYLDFVFRDANTSSCEYFLELPLLVETNTQIYADKIAFEFANRLNLPIKFISLSKDSWQKELQSEHFALIYLTDYHTLKRGQKELVNSLIENQKVVICSLETQSDFPYQKAIYKQDGVVVINDNIMQINDYVKLMVVSFQDKYPDTELSKKLGISRKSLWEKRKKLNIEKKR